MLPAHLKGQLVKIKNGVSPTYYILKDLDKELRQDIIELFNDATEEDLSPLNFRNYTILACDGVEFLGTAEYQKRMKALQELLSKEQFETVKASFAPDKPEYDEIESFWALHKTTGQVILIHDGEFAGAYDHVDHFINACSQLK